MRKIIILTGLMLFHISTTPALADSSVRCAKEDRNCAVKIEQGKKSEQGKKAEPGRKSHTAQKQSASDVKQQNSRGPKVGEVARSGRFLNTSEGHKLAKPMAGRAYRVVDDRVVLVDSNTMKVVQVLGLVSEILR
ncbi:hypothetical protein [Paracoccus yeei]|uniref:RcnB family protein n=1 Tax=Paracoccus yeei TaxID=147645 RepID=A0A2D2C720_9RHOB|nr:hypothetical protein [Paracoccus yeei]ATQ58308.1 hypothetical protein PYTT13_21040 [Paracoccus yeei]